MKQNKVFGFLILMILSISCEKDYVVETSPIDDFELFFEYLEKDYAYREAHPFSMLELKQKYFPQIKKSNTQATLATVLVSIQNELKDPHVYFKENTVYNLSSVAEYRNYFLESQIPIFSQIDVINTTPYYRYGMVKSNPTIGYIYINTFNEAIGGSNSLIIEEGVREIDTIIEQLKNKGIVSLIVDMRSYAGGSNYVPRFIAQRFINKTATYMTEYYPKGKSFVKKEWTIEEDGIGFRSGKIALLSNGITASGGEIFLLAMLQRDNLIHIGTNSVGAAGNITDKDLSNGWNFSLTNSRTEYPNGKQYFKVGITPAILVKNDEEYGYRIFVDRLIEKAIEELRK